MDTWTHRQDPRRQTDKEAHTLPAKHTQAERQREGLSLSQRNGNPRPEEGAQIRQPGAAHRTARSVQGSCQGQPAPYWLRDQDVLPCL